MSFVAYYMHYLHDWINRAIKENMDGLKRLHCNYKGKLKAHIDSVNSNIIVYNIQLAINPSNIPVKIDYYVYKENGIAFLDGLAGIAIM